MRFKSIKHAEYKLLQHLRNTGKIPLSVVMKRGVPSYVLDHPLGIEQPLSDRDTHALNRYKTAKANLDAILVNMLSKRKKDAPEGDEKFALSESWFDIIRDFGNEYEPEDDGYCWNGKEYVGMEEEE